MSQQSSNPNFAVISGSQVRSVLNGNEKTIVELVDSAYRLHGAGRTVNPPSYFLRFPDRPTSRIIALPASVGGDEPVDGVKWISSFPENVAKGLPRASGVLILNDPVTGYPYACLETSIISAARTAASAALAAGALTRNRPRPTRVGFFGVGLIARYLHTYLAATDWSFEQVGVYDISTQHAQGFSAYLEGAGETAEVRVHATPEDLLQSSDLIVFATVAGTPHVLDPALFAHNPVVLHVSLRDLSPEIILSATNVVDDVEHCLKANTSPHLAEQQVGNRDFIHATLVDVLEDRVDLPTDRPLVFSPFGLGVLDMVLGRYVYDQIGRTGQLAVVDDFFAELSRYGSAAAPSERP